ncbi:uncharacterized protein LOC126833586 [Adelges cooleyi]|uniref:uncharacterized protein LOC126833586 n=1 Tax=Adelges cooleyi TaxID=133065 RepID=UPI00218033B8|nr:uncharacterized protein LOC126833586 [Adelges cooleyi]XP_050420977.1 uncharacterized protein LOC126833586 [Adelges cooleyi]
MKLQLILLTLVLVNVLALNDYEYKKTMFITNLHIGAAFTENAIGLLTVIKNFIFNRDIPMGKIAMMLSVPELADRNRMQQAIADQIFLQDEITRVTLVPVPPVDPNRDFGIYIMGDIGEARRFFIKQLIKPLLIDALNGGDRAFYDLTAMCRLIGIYKDLKCSNSFIKNTEADYHGNCTIKNFENSYNYYKLLDGQIWEIVFNEHDISTQLLIEEVVDWKID